MIVLKVKKLLLTGMTRDLILKIICTWFLACVAWLNPVENFAEEKKIVLENPSSNEEFLREPIRFFLGRTFIDFPKSNLKLILLKAEEDHPANWLLEDELLGYLLSLNYQVALHSTEAKSNLQESRSLFYRIIQMSLEYPSIKRKGFLGARLVTREASLNLSFRLEDQAFGKVLWTKRGKEERSDLIKKSRIKSVNNQSYPFLSPSLPADPQSRFIEPVLVVAVVGGLIYLFFANR